MAEAAPDKNSKAARGTNFTDLILDICFIIPAGHGRSLSF
jgi:hypothetical protein